MALTCAQSWLCVHQMQTDLPNCGKRRHVVCQHCRVTVSLYRLCLHASRFNKHWVGAQNLWYQDNLIVWNVIWHYDWIYVYFYCIIRIATQSGALVGGLSVLCHKQNVWKWGCIYITVPCCYQRSSQKVVHWLVGGGLWVCLANNVSLSPSSPHFTDDLEWRGSAWPTAAPTHFHLQFCQPRIIRYQRWHSSSSCYYAVSDNESQVCRISVKVTLFTELAQNNNKDYTFQFTDN